MIKLNIGTVIESNSVNIDEQVLRDAISESRWVLGIATVSGHKVKAQRLSSLGEYQYRIGSEIIDPSYVEAWCPSEWMEWRED